MKNKLTATFFFVLLVVAGTLSLYFLPPVEVGGKPLRKVDLLADLRPDPEPVLQESTDTVVLPPPVKPAFVDTCKKGLTCIEDYSDTDVPAMGAFYEALERGASLGRPVRIAYFGDSFIEGDILSGELRALLQQDFGGCGVGYVPVTSAVAGFRTTVRHTFSGWNSHTTGGKKPFDPDKQDIANHYFIPTPGAVVTLKGVRQARLDTCSVSSFYFYSPDSITLAARINEEAEQEFRLPGDSMLREVSVRGRIGSVTWTVKQAGPSALCYAATMDPETGIVVDNFSTRGSSGRQLRNIPLSFLEAYSRIRTYDLLILQYGLNVASEEVRDYTYYQKDMERVVQHLREAFPEASVLIVGVGDRETRTESGELHTMPGVKNLVQYQQALAAESHVAFWNLYEAMGGEGSMVDLVERKPPMANYDYTHINFRGGKHLAKILYQTLLYGKEQYEKRKAYEAE